MNRIPLPSTFIYEFDTNPEFVEKALGLVITAEKFLVQRTYQGLDANQAVYMLGKTGEYKPFFHEELFEQLQSCVDKVCELHFQNVKLSICDAWITKTTFGKNSTLHYHPYSIFSGLLYFSDHEKSETVFVPKDPLYENLKDLFSDNVVKNENKILYNPKKAKLLIWPSDMPHYTNSHNEKNTRYTLAFNTWFTGELSNHNTKRLIANVQDVKTWHNKST